MTLSHTASYAVPMFTDHFISCTDDLFQHLYTKQTLPILLSSDVLEHIRNDFHRYHGSVAEVTLQIKTALAHHFTKRGEYCRCITVLIVFVFISYLYEECRHID